MTDDWETEAAMLYAPMAPNDVPVDEEMIKAIEEARMPDPKNPLLELRRRVQERIRENPAHTSLDWVLGQIDEFLPPCGAPCEVPTLGVEVNCHRATGHEPPCWHELGGGVRVVWKSER